ncbi:zinc-binding dehydrogenase [Algoriphagus sp. D3-2-R+10]|uniref:zinc-binding dehydrogenase n=1 Tax=Algoriphagus aurantiacus TaxID=3103948 RepID=UPI002B38391F|nr:zinc-binding dehydrogenase [Algoriphagus sp. D3-2-R+10]MEB2774350.1 zinc-binding dehydrogenase [Algoriphagus sp. D3-2-R+10]
MQKEALAMVFQEIEKPFLPLPIDFPILNQDEVLVEITYTTICTSDLHSYYGRRSSPSPSVLGHEMIGRIVNLPENEMFDFHGAQLMKGDLVTWSVFAYDHTGNMATKGIPQKSPSLFKYGHEQMQQNDVLSGGFATHCHLRKGTDIFRIPKSVSPKAAAPLNCTHATIAGAIRLAGSLKDKNVLIIGAGMLGISASTMAKFAGAKVVLAMDVNQQRIQNILHFGADVSINASLSLEEIQKEILPIGGVDVLLETSGSAEAMERGLDLLNVGGTAIWVGAVYSQRNISINAESIVRRILTIKGLHNYAPEDLSYAIKFLEASHSTYPFGSLVGAEFPLNEMEKAFAAAKESGSYRVGITPNY